MENISRIWENAQNLHAYMLITHLRYTNVQGHEWKDEDIAEIVTQNGKGHEWNGTHT